MNTHPEVFKRRTMMAYIYCTGCKTEQPWRIGDEDVLRCCECGLSEEYNAKYWEEKESNTTPDMENPNE